MPRVLPALIFAAIFSMQALAQPSLPALDPDTLEWLGDRIYANECNREPRCLASWNAGEEFPSLGIGHFIWYREGQQEVFAETFPALLLYLEQSGVTLPAWLRRHRYEQPWPDRESFQAALDGAELQALRAVLLDSMPEQTAFIVARFEAGLATLLASLDSTQRGPVERKISRILAEAPRHGSYALIDYVNFKGEGSKPQERYAGEGWGLLQVLQGMPDRGEPEQAGATPANSALADFVASARQVLARRVQNAPPERDEARWLAGWNKRLDTYLDGSPAASGIEAEQQ